MTLLARAFGFFASAIGGIASLIALGSLYDLSWLKSLTIAVVIWIIANLVSFFLPPVIGPI